ncbi:MAG TPA: radical SAM protein [Pseudonocardiaceae bacterium]|nr:radical SAM protein [Pseudonocardiaceae bacterium]
MSTAVYASAGPASPADGILSVECELTGRCQQRCLHCCTDSGPTARTGTMTHEDWVKVIHSIGELGIRGIQFIGGEPTLYPRLVELTALARSRGLTVEVYSNLVHVRPALWEALSQDGVRLATSYYSDDATEHDQITGGRGTHARIRANIAAALERGIPLRVGIVRVVDGQRVEGAEAELRALGVTRIQVDGERKVGRAAERLSTVPSTDELCGHCFRHRVAISPDGEVYGCILSRFLSAGNVKEQPLQAILAGPRWAEARRMVPVATGGGCTPDDSGDCDPANTEACDPAYDFWA